MDILGGVVALAAYGFMVTPHTEAQCGRVLAVYGGVLVIMCAP